MSRALSRRPCPQRARSALARAGVALAATLLAVTAVAENPRVALATPLGDIWFEIYLDRAPATAANFLAYVDQGRFEGATFYRVVHMGNQPGNDVKIEVVQWGLSFDDDHPRRLPPVRHETTEETGVRHLDGVLSMARNEPGTASSELFICIGDQPELDFGGRRNPDGQGFAAFGRVVRGMDVVRRIQGLPEEGQMLLEPVLITRVSRLESPRSRSQRPPGAP